MTLKAFFPIFGVTCWALGCGVQVGGDAPSLPGAAGGGPAIPGVAGAAGSLSAVGGGGSGNVGVQPTAGAGNVAGAGAGAPSLGGAGSMSNGGAPSSAGSPAMGGAPSSAGAPSAGGAGGAAPVSSHFKLLWHDDFDTFDDTHWKKATHQFAENAAQFAPANAVVEGGLLKLRVTNTPNNGHAYSAAEVYTNDQFTYGRFEARIKFAVGSGIVSSMFTYRDNINTGWNEIDLENLGYITDGVQYNLISSTQGTSDLKYQPHVVTTGFKPTADFHDYAIEWTPDDIRFFIDSKQVWRDVQPLFKNAVRFRMNCWPTNNAKTSFAGPLDTSKIPAEAQYDWVSVYSYQP